MRHGVETREQKNESTEDSSQNVVSLRVPKTLKVSIETNIANEWKVWILQYESSVILRVDISNKAVPKVLIHIGKLMA